jgi:hypothetical protein
MNTLTGFSAATDKNTTATERARIVRELHARCAIMEAMACAAGQDITDSDTWNALYDLADGFDAYPDENYAFTFVPGREPSEVVVVQITD